MTDVKLLYLAILETVQACLKNVIYKIGVCE